jgi:NADH-quinone oxidoreductase subunit N
MSSIALLAQASNDVQQIETPDIAWSAVMPATVLVVGAVLLLTIASLLKGKVRNEGFAFLAIAITVGSMATAVPLWNRIQDPDEGPFTAIAGAIGVDGFSVFVTFVILGSVVLACLLLSDYLREEEQGAAEPYALLLFSAAGGILMAQSNDLIVTFMALEALSLPLYVLAASQARRRSSQEAGMKYFVLGAFSSAFFLYGVALIYGATGSTNLADISTFLSENVLLENGLFMAGMGLLLVGFGFKISAAPFHQWTPDVYQGSPSPIVGFMAGGVKAAGFAGLLRVFYLGFDAYTTDWQPLIYALAVISLIVGAVLAVVQTDVKRMLAYSSINHAGFILVGVEAGSELGVEAVLFYLASYAAIVAGTFGCIAVIGRATGGRHDLSAYRGLSKTNPVLALAFTVFLLAQAGVPFTSGFFAKFDVLAAAIDASSYWLALVAMITAVISAFLYLRIVATMYVGDEVAEEDGTADQGVGTVAVVTRTKVQAGPASVLAIGIAVFITIETGVLPWTFTDLAADAVPVLIAP